MQQLPTHLKRYGFDYHLVKRDGKKALYAQKTEGLIVGYEVIQLNPQKSGEKFPKHEDFGFSAWCFRTEEEAEEFFSNLVPTVNGHIELPF